ncbi:RING finger protein, putative, partial [Ixodes scapularis]
GADVRANETRTAASSTQVTSNTKTEKPDPKPEKTEDHLCRLCFDKDIDCVLVDCGHLVTCYACGLKLFMGTPLCPVCRKPIKQLVKTFKT